jgi:AcrR family transcriptional regulator
MIEKRTAGKQTKSYEPKALDLFHPEPSRAQRQQIKIIETAINSFAENGLEKTTYASLARDCDISRPLVHHYFPNLEDLFLMAAKYARSTLHNLTTEGLHAGEPHPRVMLHGYIEGHLKWLRLFPNQVKFWLLFAYQCSLNGSDRKENTSHVTMGHLRIQSLLLAGRDKCGWKFDDVEAAAKSIQILINGMLLSVQTEDGYLSFSRASKLIIECAEKLLSAKAGSW